MYVYEIFEQLRKIIASMTANVSIDDPTYNKCPGYSIERFVGQSNCCWDAGSGIFVNISSQPKDENQRSYYIDNPAYSNN